MKDVVFYDYKNDTVTSNSVSFSLLSFYKSPFYNCATKPQNVVILYPQLTFDNNIVVVWTSHSGQFAKKVVQNYFYITIAC